MNIPTLKLFLAIALALVCACLLSWRGWGQTVCLAWDWPGTQTPTVSWNVYQTTNLTPPVAWTLLTNSTHKTASVQVLRQAQFFTVTTVDTTNFWRESEICPPAAIADNPPARPQNVSLTAGGMALARVKKLVAPKAR
jgi:hypothetical protein